MAKRGWGFQAKSRRAAARLEWLFSRQSVMAAFRAVASRLPARDLLVEPRRDLGEPDLATLCLDLERAVGPRT